MQTFTTIHAAEDQTHADDRSLLDGVLAPLFDTAAHSASLVASRHPVTTLRRRLEIPKFMVLGQRGGGRPIRVGFFAGFDADHIESVAALSRLLLQFELNPSLARDYAIFGYPVVNLHGFGSNPLPLRTFEARYATDSADGDVQFFKNELKRWAFDGLISFRTDANANGFYATVRSELLAREIVQPALESASKVVPLLESSPVKIRRSDRHARLADYVQGRLAPPSDVRPYPFEIELFAPGNVPVEDRIRGLFVAVHELLRNYRGVISHAPNL